MTDQPKQRKPPRPWTAEDQAQAEEMRAAGLSYRKIAEALGRAKTMVVQKLNLVSAEKARQNRALHAEEQRERTRQWYWANRERALEKNARFKANNPNYKREWDKANRNYRGERKRKLEKNPDCEREYREANRDRIREYYRQWKLRQEERKDQEIMEQYRQAVQNLGPQ